MLTSRSGSAGQQAVVPPQSIEVVRRRARHRLIGAALLVLLAVVGFPLLFDTQPRPIAVDMAIEIPSREASANLPVPMTAAAKLAPAQGAKGTAKAAAVDGLAESEEVVEPRSAKSAKDGQEKPAGTKVGGEVQSTAPKVSEKSPEKSLEKAADKAQPKLAPKTADSIKTAEKPSAAPVDKPADKPIDKAADKTAAKAGDKSPEKDAGAPSGSNERIVVQVGAFAEVIHAREARMKLERAGFKTYTHVAELPEGRRIRVRVGPYASRAEAEKAAARAKALGLSAKLLWL